MPFKIKASGIANSLYNRQLTNTASVQGGNINIYEPQTMKPAITKRMPVTTFVRDMFFPGLDTFSTKHVIFDFFKNKQRVAPFVAEGSRPINIKRDGYQTKIYTPPFINISNPYDVDLLQARLPGENVINSGVTPEERALILMQRDYDELNDMIIRREELMVAQLLQTGVVTVTGYVDDKATAVRSDTVDFGFDNMINLTGGDQWNQSSSSKYEDLERAVKMSRQAGYNPTVAVLGEDAWANMRADSNFMRHYMDLRYAQFGTINPEAHIQSGNGYTYIGRLTELSLDLFRYDAWYYDDEEGLKPYIAPEKVIVAPRGIGEMLYGAITQIPEDSINFVTIEAPRVSKVTVNRETDTKSLILKSRPIPQPFDVSAWTVINTEVKAG